MKKANASYYVGLTLISAVVYILLDLSVRLTGFLEFGPSIGIKNFLPAVVGLVFGWCGGIGCLIGSVVGALVTKIAIDEMLYEAVSVLVFTFGIWFLWHVGVKNHRVHLKKGKDYLKYILLTGGLSALCGVLSFVFLPGGEFLPVFVAYFSMSLLVGIPVIILLTSIVCVIPVTPPHCEIHPDVEGEISKEVGSLEAFNEQIETCGFERKIGMKELFGIQNCIEEIMILVLEHNPEEVVHVALYYDDSASLWFSYGGKKYNPFMVENKEESDDMFGLQLIRHRALRASYGYKRGINEVHIVI